MGIYGVWVSLSTPGTTLQGSETCSNCRFFNAADGQLEAWPVDEERTLPRALAKNDVTPMVPYQNGVIIPQNMGWYDNLSNQKSTHLKLSVKLNPLHLSTVDTGWTSLVLTCLLLF